MAKSLTFYRDKREKFKCNLHIDGAQITKSSIRLCLEAANMNYFFKGKIDPSGQCIINIPPLPNITEDEGIAIVEVIAESSYFKVHEAPFKIKNSITVKFEPEFEEEIEEDLAPKITFSLIEEAEETVISEPRAQKKKKEEEDIVDEAKKISVGDILEISADNGKIKIKVVNIDANAVQGDWLNAPKDSATKMFTIKKKDLFKTPFEILKEEAEEILQISNFVDLPDGDNYKKTIDELNDFTTFENFLKEIGK